MWPGPITTVPVNDGSPPPYVAYVQEKQSWKSGKYGVMYYWRSNLIGIRRKIGDKTQCISHGSKKCGLSEGPLRGFADDCLKKLDGGES